MMENKVLLMLKTAENWRKIWKTKGPLRLNLTLWFARHERFPIADLLHRRNCIPSPTCLVCHGNLEDTLPALRDCSCGARHGIGRDDQWDS